VQSAERLAGLRDAAAAAGRDVRVDTLPIAELNVEAGADAAARLLALGPRDRPDALFAANDTVARGPLTRPRRHGVRRPGESGRAGASLLLTQSRDPDAPPPRLTPFAAELVVRDSS